MVSSLGDVLYPKSSVWLSGRRLVCSSGFPAPAPNLSHFSQTEATSVLLDVCQHLLLYCGSAAYYSLVGSPAKVQSAVVVLPLPTPTQQEHLPGQGHPTRGCPFSLTCCGVLRGIEGILCYDFQLTLEPRMLELLRIENSTSIPFLFKSSPSSRYRRFLTT